MTVNPVWFNDACKDDACIVSTVKNPHKNLIGGFILGEPDFLNWIKETFLSSRKEEKEIPQLKELRPRLTPEAVVSEVCKKFAIDKEAMIKKGIKKIFWEISAKRKKDLSCRNRIQQGW